MSRSATLALCIEKFGEKYVSAYEPPEQVRRTLWRLEHCRTPAMGIRREVCCECGHTHQIENSCRNRHCPVCQGANRIEWTMHRKEELLPVTYFHVVFTLPDSLNAEMLCNRKEAFSSLFKAASQTLATFAEKQGVQLGITTVLHTWGSTLSFHPHLHCIVTAGGADLKTGKWKSLPWIGSRKQGAEPFLFPVKALSTMFRAKFMAAFSEKVTLSKKLREECFSKPWCVYAKSPVCGPQKVVEYLARYAYRIAISNNRIRSVSDTHVTFTYKDYRNAGTHRTMKLEGVEFIRRYAIHILPKGLIRIRHYGILSTRNRTLLASLQEELGAEPLQTPRPRLKAAQVIILCGIPIKKCPICGSTEWTIVHIRPPSRT